ncbi:hypothetical protein [Bacillus testis]|uniref:hypothetical protein n=1 Tax=Bacillus testis TaxID=1622072 RepID=UPI00067F3CB9|nr:hypothetical protein [Bacillus testis]
MTTTVLEHEQLLHDIALLKADLDRVHNQITKQLINNEIARLEKRIHVALNWKFLYIDIYFTNGKKIKRASIRKHKGDNRIMDGTEAKSLIREAQEVYIMADATSNTHFAQYVKTDAIDHYMVYYGLPEKNEISL